MITSALKDKVLFFIVQNVEVGHGLEGNFSDFEHLGLTYAQFEALLRWFHNIGFIEIAIVDPNVIDIILLMPANDLYLKGGFVLQDELFRSNIEKLSLEVETLRQQLAPQKLDTVEKIAGIAGALFAGLALLPR